MPFVDLCRPSIALGVLKAALRSAPYSVSVTYGNLLFAEKVGADTYGLQKYGNQSRLVGDWIFGEAAFPNHVTDPQRVADAFARDILGFLRVQASADKLEQLTERILTMRDQATVFIGDLADRLLEQSPTIVACTSVFQQHVASLALLRLVKERAPDVVTLVGGANCIGGMGLVNIEAFPWLDVVFSGEADEQMAPLVEALMCDGVAGLDGDRIEGVMTKAMVPRLSDVADRDLPCAFVRDLRAAVRPDYSDYFVALQSMAYRDEIVPGLPLEASRGCWWGHKCGCSFCGLNGHNMRFRAKQAEQVLDEIQSMRETYGVNRIEFVDNILDMKFFESLLPLLQGQSRKFNIFFETKANLTRTQVEGLRNAGVGWIQPGIEALHDGMLKLMNKGTTAAINLQLLKYSAEFGLRVVWHMLYRIPGEQDHWHAETARLIPLLHHLMPPTNFTGVTIQRFSLYHDYPERYGLTLEAASGYRDLYPISPERINRLAYFFESNLDYPSEGTDREGFLSLLVAIRDWKRAFADEQAPPLLAMRDDGDRISILDTRQCAVERRFKLEGLEADLVRVCEPSIKPERVARQLAERCGRRETDTAIQNAISDLRDRGLLVEVSGRLLQLAVPGEIPELPARISFPGGLDRRPQFEGLFSDAGQTPVAL